MRENRGFVLLSGMLILLIMACFVGLITDTANLQCTRLRTQTAADAAAIAAWQEMHRGNTGGMQRAAESDAARNGASKARVELNSPPRAGSFAADPGAVEARVVQQNPTLFMRIFGRTTVAVEARAVAIAGRSGGVTLGE